MRQTHDVKIFFRAVIPSVLSFALSGVYSIADGFFVGNSLGDLGLSAVSIAYPIVAVIQALGTGIGMGGAIYYSIYTAEKKDAQAREFTAGAFWILIFAGVLLTSSLSLLNGFLLKCLGAGGELLAMAKEYIAVIALGAALQVFGTGFVPFIRNYGDPFYAMVSMTAGFATNIVLDYLFVWVWRQGVSGAAWATVLGQGVTMLLALAYLLRNRRFTLNLPLSKLRTVTASILKTGMAPFALTMSPNISLIIINRFSVSYGGDLAIATYACIAYVICVIHMIVQGVGDGSQPLLSWYYGEKNAGRLKQTEKLAYGFGMFLSIIGCILMYWTREHLGASFGASLAVNLEIAKVVPIFLVAEPFIVILRITTASFYATEKSYLSYILTFSEPLFMFVLLFPLPPLFGGQIMIWWGTVLSRILSALLAIVLKIREDKRRLDCRTAD
ncbi:MAG: multidrug transporter MatE [Oscillibacter sp.]|nr:multidrug transporter MatE [Oscillibacter sp.]